MTDTNFPELLNSFYKKALDNIDVTKNVLMEIIAPNIFIMNAVWHNLWERRSYNYSKDKDKNEDTDEDNPCSNKILIWDY